MKPKTPHGESKNTSHQEMQRSAGQRIGENLEQLLVKTA